MFRYNNNKKIGQLKSAYAKQICMTKCTKGIFSQLII